MRVSTAFGVTVHTPMSLENKGFLEVVRIAEAFERRVATEFGRKARDKISQAEKATGNVVILP
jgi:hypothetical protein